MELATAVTFLICVSALHIIALIVGIFRDQIIIKKNYEMLHDRIDQLNNRSKDLKESNRQYLDMLFAKHDAVVGIMLSVDGTELITRRDVNDLIEIRKSREAKCQN